MMVNVNKLLTNKGNGNDVWNIAPDATVFSALELMEEKSVGALAVVLDGKLVGILSERDYARKVFLKGRSSKDTRVKDIMSTQVYYVEPEYSIEQCMAVMTEHHVRHLPVLENKSLVGMISLGDVVKEIISEQKIKIKELENYITWEESY
ncbi:MAG: CBS domain-containing protein [Gammaproteobacteria bacterium]|nr:CBS domain-containing protein [Gammaproteobacteria bacterium]